MKMLKLNHEVLGLCAQEVIKYPHDIARIKRNWKSRYGQKFYECTIELYDDEPVMVIKNTRNGDIYENIHEAIQETGLTIDYINKQLNRRLKTYSDYYLTYKPKEAV